MFCCGGELNSDKWFDGARVPWASTDVQQLVAVTSSDVSRPALGEVFATFINMNLVY